MLPGFVGAFGHLAAAMATHTALPIARSGSSIISSTRHATAMAGLVARQSASIGRVAAARPLCGLLPARDGRQARPSPIVGVAAQGRRLLHVTASALGNQHAKVSAVSARDTARRPPIDARPPPRSPRLGRIVPYIFWARPRRLLLRAPGPSPLL